MNLDIKSMLVDSRFYVHPTDKTALKALQAIPSFHQALKAFMNVWNEKLFKIENMSYNQVMDMLCDVGD